MFGVAVSCLIAAAVVATLEHWCVAKVVDGENSNRHHYRHHAVGAKVGLFVGKHTGHTNGKEQCKQAIDYKNDDTNNFDFGKPTKNGAHQKQVDKEQNTKQQCKRWQILK